jgi:hypothetical protein
MASGNLTPCGRVVSRRQYGSPKWRSIRTANCLYAPDASAGTGVIMLGRAGANFEYRNDSHRFQNRAR